MRSSQIAHTKARTFRSGPYLEQLLAELNRAEISARIKAARLEAGLTQPELGEILHVHWRTIQTWEDVKDGRVPWDRLDDLGKATGTNRNWLLHGDQTQGPTSVEELQELRGEVAEIRGAVDRMLGLLLAQAEPPADTERP